MKAFRRQPAPQIKWIYCTWYPEMLYDDVLTKLKLLGCLGHRIGKTIGKYFSNYMIPKSNVQTTMKWIEKLTGYSLARSGL